MKSVSHIKLLQFFAIALSFVAVSSHAAQAEEMEKEAMPVESAVEQAIEEIEPALQSEGSEEVLLTEDVIRAFYDEATKIQLEGGETTLSFLDKHTHDDAKNKVHLRTIRPNTPPEKQTLTSGKQQMLEETKAAYEKGSVDKMETEIVSMDIAEDGKSASIVENTKSDYTLALSETETVLLKSTQSCDVELVVEENVIKTHNSECNVEVRVESVDE